MKIKDLELENPFILAPMEAVNCASFRLLCKKRGAGLVFTDMIDADKFIEFLQETSKEEAVSKYINPQSKERPLCIQIGGGKIETLLETARVVSKYCDMIDYNVGCPLGYMLGKKGGVYLMKHPEQLKKIVTALRKEIKLPFSVKIRSGWDPKSINAVEVSKMLEEVGVDAITVHGRTRKELYRKRADWKLVREVKEAVKVPVILSGDVTNPYMAHMAFIHTKCDFVMVARGAMNNPSIFKHLNDYSKEYNENKTEPSKPSTTYEKRKEEVILDFEEFLELYNKVEKRYRFSELQDHAIWSVREAKNNSLLKQEIINSKTEQELIEIVRKSVY